MNTCESCGKNFPFRVTIDGKTVVTSSRKYCFECSPFGKHNTKKLTQTVCCVNCGSCDKYYANASYCKKCHNNKTIERQRKNKKDYIEYKGGKCEVCGYNKCQGALQFHHNDPNEKEFTIAKYKNTKLNDVIKNELDKCSLLCANCHAEKHFNGN